MGVFSELKNLHSECNADIFQPETYQNRIEIWFILRTLYEAEGMRLKQYVCVDT